jgi:hypothetical protein
MPRMKPQEQARKGYALRVLYRAQRNVNTSVALEAKALGCSVALETWGDGVEVPATLVAVTMTLRKMAKNSEDCITAIEHIIRQLRAPTKCLDPPPEESVVEANGSHHAARTRNTIFFLAQQRFLLNAPCSSSAFLVNSEPQSGARPSVRVCVVLTKREGHFPLAT